MLWVNTKRIIRSGFFSFWRNGFVSLASILIMIVTLGVIGSILFLSAILNTTLADIKSKVDVNVYFTTTAPEDDIMAMKTSLEALPEVAQVTYVSREAALEEFRKRHENNQLTLQALEELGENPLGASLNVKAKEPSQYEGIANYLEERKTTAAGGASIIDKVNYFQNKEAIDKLTRIIQGAERLGSYLTALLVAVSILITFNTIRLAIYMSREEIAVMRLVGASTSYIRGPFVVAGVIYGAAAGLITLALFYPVTYWLGGVSENFFIGLNVFDYYVSNFPTIFLIIIGSGIFIGAVSSFFAARKYLKV